MNESYCRDAPGDEITCSLLDRNGKNNIRSHGREWQLPRMLRLLVVTAPQQCRSRTAGGAGARHLQWHPRRTHKPPDSPSKMAAVASWENPQATRPSKQDGCSGLSGEPTSHQTLQARRLQWPLGRTHKPPDSLSKTAAVASRENPQTTRHSVLPMLKIRDN